MNIELDHVVECPTEQLFAVLGDPRRRGEWNGSVRSLEMLTDGPPGVGTRWRERTWGLGTFTIQVVEFEPPRRFAEATVGGETDLSLEFDLSTVGTGSTLIHLEARGSLSGWRAIPQRWLEPFMGRLIRRDLERAASR